MQKHRVSVAFQDCERWSLPLQAPTLKTLKVLGRAEAFDTSEKNDNTTFCAEREMELFRNL